MEKRGIRGNDRKTTHLVVGFQGNIDSQAHTAECQCVCDRLKGCMHPDQSSKGKNSNDDPADRE